MDFDIQAGNIDNSNVISLPTEVRKDLGLIPGQFLEIKTESIAFVLQVIPPLKEEQEVALVSPSVYSSFNGKELEHQILEVTLGCDPEFFILWGQRRMSATNYLPFAGQVGCDGELGELRPMYGKHEDRVVDNLHNLIKQIPSRTKRCKAASPNLPVDGYSFNYEAHSFFMNLAAGFHIHLGLPPEILNTRKEFNRVTMNHLVQCLDWYVSTPCISLEENHGRRLGRSQYGQPGDYRPSNVTLEYRTPGGFFLRSPKLSNGLLGTALLVVEFLVSRLKEQSNNFVHLQKLTKNDLNEILPVPNTNEILETLLHKDPNVSKRYLDKIRTQLEQLPNYKNHQEAVNNLFIEEGKPLEQSSNLLTNWKERL